MNIPLQPTFFYEGSWTLQIDTQLAVSLVRLKTKTLRIKKNPFAGAYYYHHEPQFHKLAVLFDMDDVKVEGERRTINISDSPPKVESKGLACDKADDESEEVNSPACFPTSKVRRKLFIDDDNSLDRESPNAKPKYFLELGEDGEFHSKMETLPAGTKARGSTSDTPKAMFMASIASSCGSSSPVAWLCALDYKIFGKLESVASISMAISFFCLEL
ncbi:hypothetical protein AAHA92_00444 [Salvia divinorum]|uniref:Uncharacterized protein n=1 Tax=Salvia divinorum TaxID=28513 RepID=A0ABD1IJK9_SALDI